MAIIPLEYLASLLLKYPACRRVFGGSGNFNAEFEVEALEKQDY